MILSPRDVSRDVSSSAASSGQQRAPSPPMQLPPPTTVWCVGRNYAEHCAELPSLLGIPQELPQEPMIFIKTPASILFPSLQTTAAGSGADGAGRVESEGDGEIRLPSWSNDIHHEVELAVQLGMYLEPCNAAVSIDLTARDVQAKFKKMGHPWTLSKSFAGACPMGGMFSLEGLDLQGLDLSLEVNGVMRQKSNTSKMIFQVAEIIRYMKQQDCPLRPGDFILTGTPEGVGQLLPGDRVIAQVTEPVLSRSSSSDKQGQMERVLSTGSWRVVLNEKEGEKLDPSAWRRKPVNPYWCCF